MNAWALILGGAVLVVVGVVVARMLAARGAALRFGAAPAEPATVGASRVALDVALAPGERLLVRERFLQDEWPQVVERIERLGLSTRDLLQSIGNGANE